MTHRQLTFSGSALLLRDQCVLKARGGFVQSWGLPALRLKTTGGQGCLGLDGNAVIVMPHGSTAGSRVKANSELMGWAMNSSWYVVGGRRDPVDRRPEQE